MAVVSDPIADFLTRIRNSTNARRRYVDVPWSRMKENIAQILKEHGYIENSLVKQDENQRGTMRVFLKYTETRKACDPRNQHGCPNREDAHMLVITIYQNFMAA